MVLSETFRNRKSSVICWRSLVMTTPPENRKVGKNSPPIVTVESLSAYYLDRGGGHWEPLCGQCDNKE